MIVQTARMRDGVRRVTEVVEVAGLEGDVFSLNPLFPTSSRARTRMAR